MHPIVDYKPWIEYPELWKTEAEFWTFLRGSLRRGLWEKSPIKLSFKNAGCSKPPEDYTGRAKSGTYCALSGEWTGKSNLDVDHCTGNKSLLSWEDVLPFILHLVPPKGSLQLVDREMHKIKNYSERMGISFQDALIAKQVIQLQKSKSDVAFIKSKGYNPGSNAKLRKAQLIEILTKEAGDGEVAV